MHSLQIVYIFVSDKPKITKIMKLQSLQEILKNNLESLKGKDLQVNNESYGSLKSFGNAILNFDESTHVYQIDICKGDYPFQSEINHSFSRDFDTVKVYVSKIIKRKYIAPTKATIDWFGTSA